MPDKTKEKGAREKIINAARMVFSDKGFHAASVSLIATQAGVNKALLFYYFNSKKNLYREIISNVFDSFQNNVTINPDDFPGIKNRFREIISRYVKEFSENRDMTKIFIREFIGLGVGLEKDIAQLEQQTRQPLVDVIKDGIERKVFRNINPNVVAASIIGILHMFYRHPAGMTIGLTEEEIFESIIALINKGILIGGNAENE